MVGVGWLVGGLFIDATRNNRGVSHTFSHMSVCHGSLYQ
ncbi:hypothetical protein JOF49_000055 [Corynebacterium suicordis]|nr:hypothetical protein [Corynebacterium suicordis]